MARIWTTPPFGAILGPDPASATGDDGRRWMYLSTDYIPGGDRLHRMMSLNGKFAGYIAPAGDGDLRQLLVFDRVSPR